MTTLTDRAVGDDIMQANALLNRIVPDTRDPRYLLTRIRLRYLQRRFFEVQAFIDQAVESKIPFADADLHEFAELARLNQIEILRAFLDAENTERRTRIPARAIP